MLVPVASRSPNPSQTMSSGTITLPPPTPSRPLNAPAAVPITASFRVRGNTAGDTRALMNVPPADHSGDPANLESLIAPLRKEPGRAAILTDIDGTIAPIVLDPCKA